MDELIARLEAAAGPDRELDAAIAGTDPNTVQWHSEDETPRYTASIDAALTLVPEGLDAPGSFKIERFYLGNGIEKNRACVWDGLGSFSSLDTASEGATPALAICIAALKARGDA